MVCLGLKPGAAGWKARTNPLSYGSTHLSKYLVSDLNAFFVKLLLQQEASLRSIR